MPSETNDGKVQNLAILSTTLILKGRGDPKAKHPHEKGAKSM
jgi:hypothetical protein